ncbi:MAG: AMP-binding protein [Prolixibacteraceae bacterium]|nr:AMP-binding protein [Prolixibacteraceae bacterium]
MKLLADFKNTFQKCQNNRAFCIDGKDFTYRQFLKFINGTAKLLSQEVPQKTKVIGVIGFDAIETYAAIFAAWFKGICVVPLNPKYPSERNNQILKVTGVEVVFSAKKEVDKIIVQDKTTVFFNTNIYSEDDFLLAETEEGQPMYILSTSGSTGLPKYVPISFANVEAYCDGFIQLFPELQEDDCFLQTYDLTSDAAFTGYLLPLLTGACVYTIPDNTFKFLAIAKLISDKKITWAKMTPSVLAYIEPYISKLDLSHLKQMVFGGEALPVALLQKWKNAFSNAKYSNLYGPTETTISSTTYRFPDFDNARAFNGIISIGKAFPAVDCILTDKNGNILKDEVEGELCIGGKQTMANYLNPVDCFYIIKNKKYYRTGDLVYRDKEGYLYFKGRLDDQVKINGYRVNLIEIEVSVKELISDVSVVAIDYIENGFSKIAVFIDSVDISAQKLKSELQDKLPPQMVPEKIIALEVFPFTGSGKIDREKLRINYLCK